MEDVFLETFRLYQPTSWICPCDHLVSALLGDLTVISMGVNSVTLTGKVLNESSKLHFNQRAVWKQRCAHDISQYIRFRITDSQWNLAVSGAERVLILGAKFDMTCIDATAAGVINGDRPMIPEECQDTTRVVELFCGGISGWSHALRAIPTSLSKIEMVAAVDSDIDCVHAYSHTHNARILLQEDLSQPEFILPHDHFVLCAALGDLSWLHAFSSIMIQLGLQSPPCPAWSAASDQAGVVRSDGVATLHGWGTLAALGVPVIGMENVAGMKKSEQWSLLVTFITDLGYTIRWDAMLDLIQIAPQRRERLLVIATKTNMCNLHFHKCIPWPLPGKSSLASYNAIMPSVSPWDSFGNMDEATLAKYVDPRFMPKSSFDKGTKRVKGDILTFRFRFPSQTVTCFLASYTQAHTFAEHVLEKNGLFGNLLVTEDLIRFFTPTEVAFMMGINHSFFLPTSAQQAMQMLGNCIAVGHAAITVLNALAFLHPHIHAQEVSEAFETITQHRLHAGDIAWTELSDGFWFTSARDVDGECIPGTVPTRDLITIGLHSPLGSFDFRGHTGIRLVDALKGILGSSRAMSFYIMIGDPMPLKIPLPDDYLTGELDIQVWTDDRCELNIDPQKFRTYQVGTSHSILLTHDGIMICQRNADTTVSQVLTMTKQYLEGEPLSAVDLASVTVQQWRQSPSAMIIHSIPEHRYDVNVWERVKITVCHDHITFCSKQVQDETCMSDFLRMMRHSRLLEFIMSLGWQLVQRFSPEATAAHDHLSLIPRAGFVSIPCNDMVRCLARQVFLQVLRSHDTLGTSPTVECTFKLLGESVWTGPVDPRLRIGVFAELWNQAHRKFGLVFGLEGQLRFLIYGRMVSLEDAFIDHVPPSNIAEGTFVLHAVLALRGGGPSVVLKSNQAQTGNRHILSLLNDRAFDPVALERENVTKAEDAMLDVWCRNKPSNPLDRLEHHLECSMTFSEGMFWVEGTYQQQVNFFHFLSTNGLEKMLELAGWMCVIRFFSYTGEPDTRGLIMPKPLVPCASSFLIREFLRVAFVILGLPIVAHDSDNAMHFRFKFFGDFAFEGFIERRTVLQDFFDLWDQAGSILGDHIPIRLICLGKQVDREAEIRHYSRPSSSGHSKVTLHTVLGLRGGGPPNDSTQFAKARNELATFLLTQGVDLNEVAPFSEKLLKAVGHQAVSTIMEPRQVAKKWDGLIKLSKSVNLQLPDVVNKQLRRNERVKQNIRKLTSPVDHQVNLEGVTFQKGFFLNADGSACHQVFEVKPKSSGVILLSQEQAEPWLSQPGNLTLDEFGVAVVGVCKGSKHSKCASVQMPGFDAQNRPLILAICLHNLGKKMVTTQHSQSQEIPVHDSAVLCFTVYRDECTSEEWESLIQHPVKHVLHAIDATPDSLPLLAPPWGRVFQKQNKKTDPSTAESFQFHARVKKDIVSAFLRLSGTHGTYISVKTEDRVLSKDYQIVWLQLSHMQLQVSATSMQQALGIVRTMRKEGKISKGIRFLASDYRDAFQTLRPGDALPPDVKANHVFKLYPTPLGATFESVQKFLESQGWGARPLRSLSSTAWLCVCDQPFKDIFASWNGQSVLVRWVEQSRGSHQLVLAGHLPKLQQGDGKQSGVDFLQKDDPWLAYKMTQGKPMTSTQLPAPVARQLDAPIEDRFKEHDTALTDMRTQLKSLQETVKTQAIAVEEGQKQTQKEFQQLRHDCKTQFDSITSSFQTTLENALRTQQGNISKQFTDLKQIMARQGKKRSKGSTQNDAEKSDEDMEERHS